MPKCLDFSKILLIGSGPIVIGQACEFDYSGTQAIRALREEGYQVVLINSNPASVMTDQNLADRVYIEPLTIEFVEKIIEKERPEVLLPTMGGQIALNLTVELHKRGILEKYKVEVLGVHPEVILKTEDRKQFIQIINEIGLKTAHTQVLRSLEDGERILSEMALPLMLRPVSNLGGEGTEILTTKESFLRKLELDLLLSPTSEVLVEESLAGWKEIELEVVRDQRDNVIIVCSIENVDPMGIHTGDSITVAPAQTLTNKEFQCLRDYSVRIIKAIGIKNGVANIQFAIHPKTGEILVVEMNPKVSRSSALASKATGFPIARVAAKLAVGYTLDELVNDITGSTPSSFEPSLDYVVVKIPRFNFERFSSIEQTLGTQMKSVGEVMAIGRTFEEALNKAVASLETSAASSFFASVPSSEDPVHWEYIDSGHPKRLWAIVDAIRKGISLDEITSRSHIDLWFIHRLAYFLEGEKILRSQAWPIPREVFQDLKIRGWTDESMAHVLQISEEEVRQCREKLDLHAVFLSVDTCAAEFEAKTPFLYSSYFGQDESKVSHRPKVMILGGGPNRIGQGVEFDTCCVQAAMALKKMGIETIMVNSNPETVSTDFDISDKLYFEPLTPEFVLNIARVEKPIGVIVQLGGQTSLMLAQVLEKNGYKILGTSSKNIEIIDDRPKFRELFKELSLFGLEQSHSEVAFDRSDAIQKGNSLGYPLVLRPSHLLGGRGVKKVFSQFMLEDVLDHSRILNGQYPILIDRFIDRAVQVDIDALSDGSQTVICGLMEYIDEVGINSGDSACSLPAATLSVTVTDRLRTFTREIGKRLKIVGLFNVQFAIQGDRIFLIDVNPRASRTVPFVSKALGKPIATLAVQVMMGRYLHDLGFREDLDQNLSRFYVRMPIFPFDKFPGADVFLGPEMKSTGEVMGRDAIFAKAYAKALIAASQNIPIRGNILMSVRDEDKAEVLPIAQGLKQAGFELWATHGTAEFLNRYELGVCRINKVSEGSPHCVEFIDKNHFQFIVSTAVGEKAARDGHFVCRAALARKIPYTTVISGARMMLEAIRVVQRTSLEVAAL